jgi:lipoate-protein ligase B
MKPTLEVRRLGRMEYGEVHALQEALIERRLSDQDEAGESRLGEPDRLLFVEHDPVVTVGRSPRSEKKAELEVSLRGTGCPVVEIERGGEATWHGPGQLVAYPIMLLPEGGRDLHAYLRKLEEVVIQTLGALGIEGHREAKKTGVWIGPKKVASIGIAVRRWVTWHGVALNLDNDLGTFRRFHPCGFDPDVMTRIADHVPSAAIPTMAKLEDHFESAFRAVFGTPMP